MILISTTLVNDVYVLDFLTPHNLPRKYLSMYVLYISYVCPVFLGRGFYTKGGMYVHVLIETDRAFEECN